MDSNHSIKQNESIFNSFNKRLLFACSLIALSQVNFGLEQGVFGATQAMPFFTQKFGVYNTKTKTWAIQPYFLSFLNSFTYIGFAFGLVMGSFISRKFGRRWCMFSMCIWAIIGATILVTSQKKEQMLVGRIIAYIYIGMELAVVPVFQSELVPRRVRGFIVGTYQFGLFVSFSKSIHPYNSFLTRLVNFLVHLSVVVQVKSKVIHLGKFHWDSSM